MAKGDSPTDSPGGSMGDGQKRGKTGASKRSPPKQMKMLPNGSPDFAGAKAYWANKGK
jgi:hypothetical protein